MKNQNDVVYIHLDRPREIRYGHKAFKNLVALTGKSLEEIEQEGFGNLELVEIMVYCGILADAERNGEKLELSQMENLLDQAPNYKHITDAVQTAFLAAWGAKPEEIEGNAPKEKKGNITSKKA